MMNTEYEGKLLGVDPASFRADLQKAGARLVLHERLMRRYVYDFDPPEPNAWVRLRDEGSRVQLTIKEIQDDGIAGTKELEIVVSDFETTHAMLQRLGYVERSYQENRRESWSLDDVAIEIDQWPGLAPYVEIEASSEDSVVQTAKKLGHDRTDLCSSNTKQLYAEAGIDLDGIPILSFDLFGAGG
jgi:adenylate cyclase class 2